MINNRQSGRRRGRGGQRPQGGPGRQDGGNRIDNRARGNAAQLLEKYKTLARDAQLSSDRVMTEYYLQFADHYFRVLSESRARFEENNPRRQRDDFSEGDEDGEELRAEDQDDQGEDDYRQPQRREQDPRREQQPEQRREQQEQRPRRDYNDRPREQAAERPRDDAEDAQRQDYDRRPRRDRPRRDAEPRVNGHEAAEETGFDANVLPPSFSAAVVEADAAEEAPAAPRRRGRPRKVVEEQAPVEG